MTNYPSHVKPSRKPSATAAITQNLVDERTALKRLSDQRTALLEKIRTLSLEVLDIDVAARQIEATIDWQPPSVQAKFEPVPEPEPEPKAEFETTTGGRPISGVFSTVNWLKILEGGKRNIEDVALFYDRPESGIARIKARADNGELPDSKVKDQFFMMVLDGEDAPYICEQLKKPLSWVQNYRNLLTAYSVRRNNGQSIPANIEALLSTSLDWSI